MFNELITNIRQLIERSLEDTKQPWNYSIRVRYKIDNKNVFIIYEKDGNQRRIEVEENEEDEH